MPDEIKPKRTKLTRKERSFVTQYLIDKNATQAAIRSGFSKRSAYELGSKLLRKVEICEAVEAGMAKVEEKVLVDKAYVIGGLKEVAERCLTRAPVMVRDGKEMVQKVDENGNHVWEFDSAGANGALSLLGKSLNLFTERVQVSGKVGIEELVSGAARINEDKP